MKPARQAKGRTAPILATCTLLLAGCASTRYEPPPEVVPQPPQITTSEAIADGLEAAAQLEVAETDGSAQPPPGPVTQVERRKEAVRRYAPADITTGDVRSRHQAAPMPLDFGERVDHAHDRFYTWTQGVVEATDHRFADPEGELKPVPAAPFRIGLVLESVDRSDGFDINLDADIDIALSLPNIESRLRLFVTSNELDESPRDARSETALRAGVRYPFLNHFNFDLGAKLDLPPVAFASVRWSRQYELGRWEFYPLAKLFADSDEGVGYVGAATFDRWSGRHLFRSSSYGKWRSDRDRLGWTQTLIYARANQLIVPDRYGSYLRANDIGRGWGARALASGGKDIKGVEYYEFGVFYRQPTSNRWLYWFVEPLVRWDREYDWHSDPGIRIGIDALFWDLARPVR